MSKTTKEVSKEETSPIVETIEATTEVVETVENPITERLTGEKGADGVMGTDGISEDLQEKQPEVIVPETIEELQKESEVEEAEIPTAPTANYSPENHHY
jgi:hypothetical protein